MSILQFSKQVERAVFKYVRGHEAEVEDLRQEAWLALAKTEVTSPAHAYLVAKSAVRSYLEHRYGSAKRQRRVFHAGPVGGRVRKMNDAPVVQEVSTTEPAVFHEAEQRTKVSPALDAAIDAEVAQIGMTFLPDMEQMVLAMSYGLTGEVWTLERIAAYFHITISSVYRLRERALKHLRGIMGVRKMKGISNG